jgi:hypothetical protein
MKRAPTLAALKRELAHAADPNRAGNPIWFKTGKGEYAEGDKFLGVVVPMQRAIAEKYHDLKLVEIEKLLASCIHEYRYTALLILVAQYQAGDASTRQRAFDFYVKHTHCCNNWDLVDTSASYIVGGAPSPTVSSRSL